MAAVQTVLPVETVLPVDTVLPVETVEAELANLPVSRFALTVAVACRADLRALLKPDQAAHVVLTAGESRPAAEITLAVQACRHAGAARVTIALDVRLPIAAQPTAWLSAALPQSLDLTTPVLSAATAARLGQTLAWRRLTAMARAAAQAGVTARLVWLASAEALADLHPETLDALARQWGLSKLELAIKPGDAPVPRLDLLARQLAQATPTQHRLVVSDLWPACARPERLPVEASFPSEQARFARQHAPGCETCRLRQEQRCGGLVPAWLADLEAAHGLLPGPQLLQHHAQSRPPRRVTALPPLLALSQGWRQVWRCEIPSAEEAAWRERLAGDATWLGAPGPLHVEAAVLQVGTGLTETAQGPPEMWRPLVLFVALDPQLARHALALEQAALRNPQDARIHRQIAELYGYPPCCVAAFLAAQAAVLRPGMTDDARWLLQAAQASERFDSRLNVWGPGEATLVSHLPCRFDCPASLDLAGRIEARLAELSPDAHAMHLQVREIPWLAWADGALLHLTGVSAARGLLNPRVREPASARTPPELLEALRLQLHGAEALVETAAGLQVQRGDHAQPVERANLLATPGFPLLLRFT